MKFTKVFVLALLIVATIVTCVACGNSQKGETTTTTTTKKDDATGPCIDGRQHDWEVIVEREATCGMQGKKVKKCTKCGEKEKIKGEEGTIPALEHVYGDEILTKEATCKATGKKYKVCQNEGCDNELLVEELPIVQHNYTYEKDSTGKFEVATCSVCGTKFRKNATTKGDLFEFHMGEIGFEPSALKTFNTGFEFAENGFDPYTYTVNGSSNTIAAMKDGILNSVIRIKDTNLYLKELPAYVLQFDVMLTSYPEEGKVNSFVSLEYDTTDSNGNSVTGYSKILFLLDDGTLSLVGEKMYGEAIEGVKLELNTWYNIAVVLRDAYVKEGDSVAGRIKTDLYIDNKKVELKTQIPQTDAEGNNVLDPITGEYVMEDYTAENGAAAYEKDKMAANYTIRIGDGGYGGLLGGSDDNSAGITHGIMALDNILIYEGKEVKPMLRGEITLENGEKDVVSYPTEIKKEEFDFND